MSAAIRQMTHTDVDAVVRLQVATFADLERRHGAEPTVPHDLTPARGRVRHLVETDPGGAWVTEEDGELRAAALALVREGVWGLSLLVVDPAHQSAGLGRALLERTLAYGEELKGWLLVSSEDSRALRAYHRAGFDLRPCMDATGQIAVQPAPGDGVRAGRWPEDREVVDAAGRFVRGAGHGPDVPAWLSAGGRLYVHDDGGFAVINRGAMKVVAAHDEDTAAALLRAALRELAVGADASVEMITAGQDWAVETALDAGLQLKLSGAVMARGAVGPLAPYLPSGAYL